MTSRLAQVFLKESRSFDRIAADRKKHRQVPDLRADFRNTYFYNNVWRSSVFLRDEFGSIADWFIRRLRRARVKNVVELGCGNGWLSLELARAGFRVTGLDFSPESIRVAGRHLDRLPERRSLSLRYSCVNILDFDGYAGRSVVSCGFLHHLPPATLREVLDRASRTMHPRGVFLAMEPRYDHARWEMALLIYALRLALPNHFKYGNPKKVLLKSVQGIFDELREKARGQSELDFASDSRRIERAVRARFGSVELEFGTAFFDKLVGSVRISQKDEPAMSRLLKQLDDLIVRYTPAYSRNLFIHAKP